MMPQFLLSEQDIAGKRFILRGPEAFHITKVLRHRPGDSIKLFDGRGNSFMGLLETFHSDGAVEGRITQILQALPESVVRLRLYLGLLKASHWEWALEKGTELGIDVFVPLITPRTVVRLKDIQGSKAARFHKILLAAAKQSQRPALPKIESPVHFRDAIVESCRQGPTLLGWERACAASPCPTLREVLRGMRPDPEKKRTIHLFIGPEGGFSDEEVELAMCEGAKLFSLGSYTLRSETAAIAATTIILYELGHNSPHN